MLQKMSLPRELEYILDALRSRGYRADVVGGAVRDHLLGRPSYDYDVTTEATPDEVKSVFADKRTVDTGIKHGTVTLVLDSGSYEITTWRVDGAYLDSRHPESVTFTRSLSEDLARRDFTVNAISYNPTEGYTDLFGGMQDLEGGIIRAVGEPARRFDEDALRIMRAVRFAATLGFKLDPTTAEAAEAKRHLLSNVSSERIYTELKKLISGDFAHRALLSYPTIILEVLPELDALGLPDEHKFAKTGYTERLISLFFLGAKQPNEAYSAAMSRLKTDTEQRVLGERALELLSSCSPTSRYEALKMLSRYGRREADIALRAGTLIGRYGESERMSYAEAIESGAPYQISELAIGGRELMSLGLRGKEVGKALSTLLDDVMRGECENTAEALLGRCSDSAL